MRRDISLPALLAPALVLGLGTAKAENTQPKPVGATLTIERHATTNALDSDFELFDWYSLLRGTLEHQAVLGDTIVSFAVEGEARSYDTYDMEDDATLTATVRATRKFGERFELRGTLAYTIATEGDDFPIGEYVVGIRTASQKYQAGLEAGIDLGSDYTLVLAGSAAREIPQLTRFQQGVLDPVLLSPQSDRYTLSAQLTRSFGKWTSGANFAAEWLNAGQAGAPPYDFRLAHHTAMAEVRWAGTSGTKIQAAFGAQRLAARDGAISQTRPAYAASIDVPFKGGVELRAAIRAGFDTVDGDDPLASWLRRLEFEASAPLAYKIKLAGGLFSSRRENLSLLTVEYAQGVYLEASRPMSPHLTAILRVDAENKRITSTDYEQQTIDVQIGLTGKI